MHVDLEVGRPVLVEYSIENFVWDLTVSGESPGPARWVFGVGLREPSRIDATVQPELDTPESDPIDVAGVQIGASRSEFLNDPVCICVVLSGDRIGGRESVVQGGVFCGQVEVDRQQFVFDRVGHDLDIIVSEPESCFHSCRLPVACPHLSSTGDRSGCEFARKGWTLATDCIQSGLFHGS